MTEALPESISPESLTLSLRRAGVLCGGRVSSIDAEVSHTTIASQITRLRLAYEGDSEGAPAALILKIVLPERNSKGLERRTPGSRVLPGCRSRHAARRPAALFRRRMEPRNAALAPAVGRSGRVAHNRDDLAAAADATRLRADRPRLGALSRILVGQSAAGAVDRILGERRGHR